MLAEEKLKLFEEYQNNSMYHPLTCSNDSRHAKLKLSDDGHFVYCADCEYIQHLKYGYFDELKQLINV